MPPTAEDPGTKLTPWLRPSLLILLAALTAWLSCGAAKRAANASAREEAWKRMVMGAIRLEKVRAYWFVCADYEGLYEWQKWLLWDYLQVVVKAPVKQRPPVSFALGVSVSFELVAKKR